MAFKEGVFFLFVFILGHSFGTYTKVFEKLTFLTSTCAYQGARIASFSKNFVYVLIELLLRSKLIMS